VPGVLDRDPADAVLRQQLAAPLADAVGQPARDVEHGRAQCREPRRAILALADLDEIERVAIEHRGRREAHRRVIAAQRALGHALLVRVVAQLLKADLREFLGGVRHDLAGEVAVAARDVPVDVDDTAHREALGDQAHEHAAHRVADDHRGRTLGEPRAEPARERGEIHRRFGPRRAPVAGQIGQHVGVAGERGVARDRLEARRRFAEPVDPDELGPVAESPHAHVVFERKAHQLP